MRRALRLLILEDQPDDALLMVQALERAGLAPDWTRVGTEADFLAALDGTPDLILAGDSGPGFDAVRALTHLVARGLDIPAIVVSEAVSEELAAECTKRGATDYLLKGQLMRLGPAVIQALDQKRTREQHRRAEEVAEALTAVGRELAATLDPGVVTDRIVSTLARLFRVRRAVLFQRDPASDLLVCVAASDDLDPRRWIGQTISLDTSIAGLAFRDGRPTWTADVLADPRVALSDAVVARLREDGARSVVAVPLRARGEVLGALSLGDVAGRTLDADELSLLSAFADQTAIALQNARLFQATQSQLRQTETLLAVSQSVSSTLDPVEMMRRVSREAGRALGADVVGAVVPDAEGRTLRGLAGYRVPKPLRPLLRNRRIPLKGHPFLVEAWEHQRVVFSSDVTADARIDPALVEGIPFRSVLFIPLLSRHDLVGGLLAAWREPAREFTSEELRLAEGIGRQAALALGNTRLFEAAERRREHAESLAELGRVVSQSLHPDVVGQRVANGLLPLLGAQSAALYRLEPGSGNLVALAVAHRDRPTFPADLVIPPGAGVIGIAVRERRPAVTTDSLTDPRVTLTPTMRTAIERSPHRAVLAAPILFQDRVIGALTVVDGPGRTFDAEEIRLAEAFADHAALALENARHYEEAQRREREAAELARVARTLAESLDATEIGQRIVQSLLPVFGAPLASLRLLQPDGSLVLVATAGGLRAPFDPGHVLPPRTGIVGRAVTEGRAVWSGDGESRLGAGLAESERRRIEATGVGALLAAPLRAPGGVLGVLSVVYEGSRAFSEAEVSLLQAFADQAALALENARHYGESERRRQEAEALARLTQALTESLDVEAVGERIAESVQALFDAQSSILRALEPDGSLVVIAAAGHARGYYRPGYRVFAGVGLIGRVAREGRPLWTPDVAADPDILLTDDVRLYNEGAGMRSILAVPLRVKGQVTGVLGIVYHAPRAFTEREVALLQAVADQGALALENARHFAESERRRNAAEVLAEVGRLVSQSLDPDAVGQRIIESVRGLFRAMHAVLHRLDLATGDLVAVAFAGLMGPGYARNAVLPRGTGVAGLAVRDGRTVTTADILADPRVELTPGDRTRVEQSPFRAVMAVPLVVQERVIGALSIADAAGRAFTADESELAQALAHQAALALQNARLYDESERRRHEAEQLARLTRRLTGSLDVATVAQRVVDSVQELLGTRLAGLRLLQADGSLVALASAGTARDAFPPGHVQPAGTGIMARVVAEGRALWTPDILAERDIVLTDDLRDRLAEENRALLVVPLRVEGETIGVLAAGEPAGRAFTDGEIGLLQAVADQAALALQNARSHEAAVRRGEELAALLRAARTVMAGLDLDAILRRIVEEAARIAGTPHVKVLLVDSQAHELRIGAVAGSPVPPNFRVPLGTSYSGRVATTGRPLHVGDTQNDPENLLAARDREQGIRTYLGLPIRFGDEVLGVLTFNTAEPHEYTPAELAYLGSFADQAALAIRNAQLLEQSRQAYAELARTQDHLVQGEKMQAVGRLAGGVAHDFNNLLTVILGRSHMLLKRLAADDPLRRYAMLIHQTGERAAALTQQLLAFSRRQVLQPRVLDLNGVVAGMDKMLRRLIGEDVELVTRLGPGLGHVKADQAQLEQVLMNLAVNARDAMPLGGRLTIATGDVELDAAAARGVPDATPGRYVTLAVTDSGTGMDAATQARIFEPFFTTKGAGKGTGLGLATVFGIVRQSDGYIRVDSEVGRGSTFTIHLPRVDDPVEAAPREGPGQGIVRGSETVLLVEDESELRELTSEMLEGLGYTVVKATDGQDALRIAAERAGRLQLLLTDVVMPQMSGRELAQRLGSTQPDVRVLYMSGYTQEAISRHGVLDPGTALIQKPFSQEALACKVREVLDQVPVPVLAERQSGPKGVSHDQPARSSS